MSDSARVNGVQYGWSSIKFKIDGEPFSGVKSIDYSESVEQAMAYGLGKHFAPRGRTRGKYTPEPLVVEVFTATATEIMTLIAQRAGARGLSSVPLNITIQLIEPDEGVLTIECLDATFVKTEVGLAEGPDPITKKLTFQPMRYKHNGRTLYDTSEAGA